VFVSAEIRWFWQGAGPAGLREWFIDGSLHDCAAGGGGDRVDEYLSDPRQAELGIKMRGNATGVEIKGLVAVLAEGCQSRVFPGRIEIWAKWSSEPLSLAHAKLVRVGKRRWLRSFDCSSPEPREIALDRNGHSLDGRRLPKDGCNVEYTEISLAAAPPGVTLGFEAFGELDNVVLSLRQTAERLSLRQCPALVDGWSASYPKWLQRIAERPS
jgi:hypothetical protein